MSIDNPYYFYNDKSPRTPDSTSSKSGGFSFFKRRNSKSNGSSPKIPIPSQQSSQRTFNSATLSQDAAILGSPRGSLGSVGSYCGTTSNFQAYEMQQQNASINGIYRKNSTAYRKRLGSYNESISYSENDDVFVSANNRNITSRTLNSLETNPNRRHSLGQLTNRERKRCSSFSDEAPKMMAPKPPSITTASMSSTKYRTHHRKESCGNSNMDDILIITTKHSERAIIWANFLKNRFDKITKQRGRKPFNFLHIKIDEGPFSNELSQKCQQTALQIVILCPAFLALSHSYLMTQLSAILKPDKVLGILLEVPEEKAIEIHKTALPSYRKWKRCFVRDNDHSLIGNILGIATDILGRALCQRPPCQEGYNNNASNLRSSNSTEEFTVVPRKVRIGQNKILILLNEPLTKDDWIKITIEKSGETIDVNSYKKRNPFTIQFSIPETCMEISTMIEIRVEKNDKDLGYRPVKCESRLRELEQLLRTQDSPIEFMCHSLGIASTERDALDVHLLQCFQKNMPSNFHLLAGSFDKQNGLMNLMAKDSRSEEFPTLLHFAAKWGFERLCLQLMECPGGDVACEMRNSSGKTPAEIAEHEGFQNIAKNLKSFSQIHEFTTMYHYFKGISDSVGSTKKVIIEPQALSVDLTTAKKSEEEITMKAQSSQNGEDVVDNAAPTAITDAIQAEYMEMSSGSDTESSRPTTLAVTNLNYINIEEQEDCNHLKSTSTSSSDDVCCKQMEQIQIIEDSEITSNELHIKEPPYYQSNDNNNQAITTKPNIDIDKLSQECTNALENYAEIAESSASSSTSTVRTASNYQLDYMIQPSNIPVTINGQDQGDYMIQPSNRPVENLNYMNESIIAQHNQYLQQNRQQAQIVQQKDDDSHLMMNFEKKKPISRNGTLKRSGSDTSSRGNADDELAEIMYDFKNNVLTIREVEQLVEKWKNRNDVKQSFKEKQEQIEKLREEYERIQDQMKAKLKRPTPFERVKKLFSRNKQNNQQKQQNTSCCSEDTDTDTKSSVTSFQCGSQRPMSTLSLQSVSSSSSSGRMSTASACSGASLGDSGTHSDHEDRRQIFNTNCRLGSPGSLMDNYLIPPPPRPVLTPTSTTPTPIDEKENPLLTMINRNNSIPSSPSKLSEHYIIFPSNIPVFNNEHCPLNNNNHNNNNNNNSNCNNNNNPDSMPFCGLNTIIETKETMNEICVKPIKVQTFNHDKIINKFCNTNLNNNGISGGNMNMSSFKPKIINSSSSSSSSSSISLSTSQLIDIRKEMSEVYQNINGLDKPTKLENDNKISKLRQNSFESNNPISEVNCCVIENGKKCELEEQSNQNDSKLNNSGDIEHHNYMNV